MILELFTIWDNCYYEKIGDEVKNIDDEIPFEIPYGWEWSRLGNVLSIFGRIGFRGYNKKDIVKEGLGAISISPSNISGINFSFDKCTYISWEKYYESPEIMIENGDIILVKTGSSYGKCAIIDYLPEKATINPQSVVLKNVLIEKKYLLYVLNSPFAKKQYEEFVIGAAIPTFSQEKLSNFLIPIPPLEEQKMIVCKIEKMYPLLEIIYTNETTIRMLIEKTKQKILDSFFGENSSYKSYYSNLITTNLSKIISKDKIGDGDWVLSDDMDEDGEYDLVQLKHIGHGDYIHKPYQSVNNAFFSNNNCSEIHSNYILINRIIAKGLNICILPSLAKKTITSVDVCWIAPDEEKYDQRYLMYLMLSPSFQKSVLLQSSGSTRMRISKSKLIKINFYYHDNIRIQKMIADELQKVFSLLNLVTS